jgi:hypothetical protein
LGIYTKVTAADFNIHIKTICQICEMIIWFMETFDKDLKRKKVGYYRKYQLISSRMPQKYGK